MVFNGLLGQAAWEGSDELSGCDSHFIHEECKINTFVGGASYVCPEIVMHGNHMARKMCVCP